MKNREPSSREQRETVARRKIPLRRLALEAGIGIAALLLLLLPGCLADRVIFQPPEPRPVPAGELSSLELENGGTLSIAYRPAPPGGLTLLYSHGNAEDLSGLPGLLRLYQAHGYGILAYDYEGYGASSGTPSEAATERDIERCWRYLVDDCGVAPASIVLYGRSVGSGPAVWLAGRVPALALVLEAPFTSAFSVVKLGFLPFDRFPNLKRVGKLKTPLLIFHGDADQVIPFAHGEKLFAHASEPKQLSRVKGAGHNDLLEVAGTGYWTTLADFLTRVRAVRR